jgi:hypothetical protein
MLKGFLYKIGIIRNITLIGEQIDGETKLYYHLYTHNGIPNTGDYITLTMDNQLKVFIVTNKSFTYTKKKICWILITPLEQNTN